jgi:hypothetical protein
MLVAAIGSLPERSEQRLPPLEGEEQKVDHPERRVVGPEHRPPGRVADDRHLAPLHGAVEGLGDDAGADSLQLAPVELGLTQNVEPERRVPEERVTASASCVTPVACE